MQNFEKAKTEFKDIQIQHLLKLNANMAGINLNDIRNSNTTFVKVKWWQPK